MKPYEFWHPRVFEAPYYAHLLLSCARYRLPVKFLAKANFGLDHGELGLGSKYSTQMKFEQTRFLPTVRIEPGEERARVEATVDEFIASHGLPLIFKPDNGAVGKGIRKVQEREELMRAASNLRYPHLIQVFTPNNFEYGVFYMRSNGVSRISGINRKHFPTVVGNGRDSIETLAHAHYRFNDHWRIFLKYFDTSRVPAAGERVQLSFIGSHTMGCLFTDDTHLVTPALEQAVFQVTDSQPGFNFGRLDIKAESEEAFCDGEFVVIEINGIASLPTHMFDPANTLRRAYRIFFEHGDGLVAIADEHRDQPMELKSYSEIWKLAKSNHTLLSSLHEEAIAA